MVKFSSELNFCYVDQCIDAIINVRSKLDGTAQGFYSSKKLTNVCNVLRVASNAYIWNLNSAQNVIAQPMS
jgi:hypothetical protein